MNKEAQYEKFISTISFFEFCQEEFKESQFNTKKYELEIQTIEEKIPFSVETLREVLRSQPRVIDVFEQIFQQFRYSNTQLLHFLFDIQLLNNGTQKDIMEYVKYNLDNDSFLQKLFSKQTMKEPEQPYQWIGHFKSTISSYVLYCLKNADLIHKRIQKFFDVQQRVAEYLLENLRVNSFIKGIHLKVFLEQKRIPHDIKAVHGNFGSIKLKKILSELSIPCIDIALGNQRIIKKDLSQQNINANREGWSYCTERMVDGIFKRRGSAGKKFDFIILKDLQVKYVVETNFYSTSGTKIGINEDEYVDLHQVVTQGHPDISFLWITDGNYWFSCDGKNRYYRILDIFGQDAMTYQQFRNKMRS